MIVHSTFVIERTFTRPPEVVFAAFAEADKKRLWFAEGPGHELEEFSTDFSVGGLETMRYRMGEGTPIAGAIVTGVSTFLAIEPGQRIISGGRMNVGDRTISASLVTIELRPAEGGTAMTCTNQVAFFENSDGPEMREMGWRLLFDRLSAQLVGE